MTLTSASSLLRLDPDVLVQIFEELRPLHQLHPLSESSKYVRLLAMPILFRECRVYMRKSITAAFLPTSLWPYVRSLMLIDGCPPRRQRHSAHRVDPSAYSLRYSDDPLLCGALDAGVLKRSLPAMPRLRSIAVLFPFRDVHAIRGDVAAALLSAPQVRDVRIALYLLSPRQSLPHDSLRVIPPLTTFRYTKNPHHVSPRTHPPEVESIRLIMSKLHRSLEVLELPSETVSLDVMSQLDWPRLRCLTLAGDGFPQPSIPIIAVVTRMPCLRILTLKLTILPNMSRQCIWPREWAASTLLPQIEELTVAHPHPEDLLYTRLPGSIRRLSLCCSPCYALQRWLPEEYHRWSSPLSTASELLRILSGSHLPHLAYLSIDYSPDDEEEQLSQYLPAAYPCLSSIELHRLATPALCWPEDDLAIPVLFALSRWPCLCEVRLNLYINYGNGPRDERAAVAWLQTRLLATAQRIATLLGPTVTSLSLLIPRSTKAQWLQYRIFSAETTKHVVSETKSVHYVTF